MTKLGVLRWEMTLDYYDRLNIITEILVRESQEDNCERLPMTSETGVTEMWSHRPRNAGGI